jgi:hypothetical protein
MKKNAKYGSKNATKAVANATKVAVATVNAPIKATVNVAKYPSRTFTQREQADKLTGYLEVGSNVWPQIRYGTHIRYYLKTGEFRTGGFVAKNPVEVVISEDNDIEDKFPNGKKMYIKIQNGFNDKLKGFYQWVVAYDDIDKIYIKPDAGVLTMVHTLESIVGNLNENIQKLALTARVLEKRISQLEKAIA